MLNFVNYYVIEQHTLYKIARWIYCDWDDCKKDRRPIEIVKKGQKWLIKRFVSFANISRVFVLGLSNHKHKCVRYSISPHDAIRCFDGI